MKKTFNNPRQLQKLIDKYFQSLEPVQIFDGEGNMVFDKNGVPVMSERKPATVASLVYAVGLSSKLEFVALEDDEEYREIIKRAFLRTEAYIERMLFDKAASGGAKYLLQECFDRMPGQEEDCNAEGGVVILSDIDSETN